MGPLDLAMIMEVGLIHSAEGLKEQPPQSFLEKGFCCRL